MSFDEGLFYIYLIATGLLGISGTIRGLRLICGWEPRFADQAQSLKWFVFVRSLTELAFVYLAYQLFKRQLLSVLPISLMGLVFSLVIAGLTILVGNHFRKKISDSQSPS